MLNVAKSIEKKCFCSKIPQPQQQQFHMQRTNFSSGMKMASSFPGSRVQNLCRYYVATSSHPLKKLVMQISYQRFPSAQASGCGICVLLRLLFLKLE